MKNFNIKSKKGFTLIELLVVIGILAVLTAIAIPSIAGLIDRANVSSDNTNADEMTNAIQRFTSEYELYCQDITSGTIDFDNLDSAQGRVYNVTGIQNRKDIEDIEKYGKNGIVIDSVTKYPQNLITAKAIIENYTKTSSSTFEPKQTDKCYFLSPDTGTIVVADKTANYSTLNAIINNGTDGSGKDLDFQTDWMRLTNDYSFLYVDAVSFVQKANADSFKFTFGEVKENNGKIMILHNNEYKTVQSLQGLILPQQLIPKDTELTENTPSAVKKNIIPNASDIEENNTYSLTVTLTGIPNNMKHIPLTCRLLITTDTGEKIYTQCIHAIYNELVNE